MLLQGAPVESVHKASFASINVVPPAAPKIALRGMAELPGQDQSSRVLPRAADSGTGMVSARLAALRALVSSGDFRRKVVYSAGGAACAALLIALLWPKSPEARLSEKVKAYVESVGAGKYERAYNYLTAASQKDASLDVFSEALKTIYTQKRVFRAFQVEQMSETQGVVGYMYKDGNGPWRFGKTHMVKENGQWKHPFAGHLYSQLENALKKDLSQGPPLLERMRALDQFDPKINGYSCRVLYTQKKYKDAIAYCSAACHDSITTPFMYSEDQTLLFRFMLADSYMKNFQTVDALREYTAILVESQQIPADYSCRVSRQLVQGYVKIGNYDAALNEAVSGQEACVAAGKKREITLYLHKLCGNYPYEAIKLARSYKAAGQAFSLQQAWEKEQEIYRLENSRRTLEGRWEAERIAGPHYRVQLKVEGGRGGPSIKYDLLVNILSGRVVRFPVEQLEKGKKGGKTKS